MKLEINLADREEIAAAVPLLQLILDGTLPAAPETVASLYGKEPPPYPNRVETHGSPALDADAAKLEALAGPGAAGPVFSDPAVVFGGAQPAAPLAPSMPPAAVAASAVPPPPATSAPTMPTHGAASLAAPAVSVELDKNGLPWDARIHAGSKAKISDGSWRMKKQVDETLVASVEAELRASMATPAVVPTPPAAVPAAMIAADPGIAAPAAAVSYPTTFEQLMPRISAAVASGKMPPTALPEACSSAGLASIVMLQQNPQYVGIVWATLERQYPGI